MKSASHRDMTASNKRDKALHSTVLMALLLAAAAVTLWLVGVHKQSTMLLAGHARDAFAAVKMAAGLRMQVRKLDIGTNEMVVHAVDPDMPDLRWSEGNRTHPSRRYSGQGVKEQSWRVTHWTVFGRDWYRVRGPIVEGIIQQNEGPAFDLRSEELAGIGDVIRKAVPHPVIRGDPCPLRWTADARVWTICGRQGDPFSVSVQAAVSSQ
jgi:hypothetical protein